MTYPTEDYHFLVPSKPPLEPIEDGISRLVSYYLLDHTQTNPVDGDEVGPAQGVLPQHRYHLHDHTKADAPNKAIWAWDAKLKQYRHLASGKIIGPKRMLELRDIYTDRQALRAEQLVEQLVRGEISLQDWLLAQRQLIKETYIAQYAMARGGRSQMTPQDYGRLGADLKKQYAYLQAFGQDIQSGKYRSAEPANLIARIANRIKLYIESATQAFEKGKIAVFGGNLYDHITNFPGAGKTRCLTRCRCHLDVTENETEWLVRWVLDPAAEHCEDCVSLSEQWNPLRVAKPKSIVKAAGGPVSSGVFMFERDPLETFIPGKAVIISSAGTYHDSATGKFTSKTVQVGNPKDKFKSLPQSVSLNGLHEQYRNVAEEAFNFIDEESGLAAVVDSVSEDKVAGGVYDRDGAKVGEFHRDFAGNTVKHAGFRLSEELQQSGFGGRFYKHSEEAYLRNGLKEIELEANMTVGGYAWARMGFDFAHKSEAGSFVAKLMTKYMHTYGYESLAGVTFPETAYEMAAFTGPDGRRIGKEFLLGSRWMATKRLNPNDSGYMVGQLYYESKGVA